MSDYSRVTRGRFNSFKAMRRSSDASDSKVEGLYLDVLDIFKCLSFDDMQAIVKIISKV
jgi:hypothetical protein